MTDKLAINQTALVVIDVQKGIVNQNDIAPLDGPTLVARNQRLLTAAHKANMLTVLVRVQNTGEEGFNPVTDVEYVKSQATSEAYSELLLATDNVIIVNKHNWGAFYGTDLDVQLRRYGIKTIILTGIATSIGVDTTAREATQAGYEVIFVPEAMTDLTLRGHEFATEMIFPRLGKIKTLAEVVALIEQ